MPTPNPNPGNRTASMPAIPSRVSHFDRGWGTPGSSLAGVESAKRGAENPASLLRFTCLLHLTPFLFSLPLLLPPRAFAQTTYTVSGTVTSALDNHPLQNATVELVAAKGSPVQTATSDELGHFAFSAVPKGDFILRGETPGFLQSSLQQHGAFSTAVVTGASVSTEGLTLQLKPLGSLSGTVTDESSEPIRNAAVHIFRRDPLAGDQRLSSAAQLQTDDLGHYELARLAPGTYFVAVTATPWYAIHPNIVPLPTVMGVVPYHDPTLDVAYPVTYFPTGSDPARASPIQINGNEARADIQLTPVPALTITLDTPADSPGGLRDRSGPVPQLQQNIFGQPTFTPAQIQQTPTGTVANGLAPGDYTLRSYISTPNPDHSPRFQPGPASPLHITSDGSASAAPTSSSLAHLHVTLRSADGDALPPNLQLQLIQSGHRPDPELRRPTPSHQADFEAQPGDYYLTLFNAPGTFIRDLTLAGKPLPSNDIHLTAGDSLTATVAVARGTHALRGFVHSTTESLSAAMLVLVPADQHLPPRASFRDQSNLDGSFQIPDLPPGPYLLLALPEPAWNADWLSADFLSRHLPHATPVLIRENAPAQVDLPEPINIQPL